MTPQAAIVPIGMGVGATIENSGADSVLDIDPQRILDLYEATGAVFLRGFAADLAAFEELTSRLMRDLFTNRGAAFSFGPFKRSTVNNNPTVMTATGNRQDFPLPLHGEFYYFKEPPRMIWFYCANPAPEGGETTIADGARMMNSFSQSTAGMLETRRIKYVRHLAADQWQDAFQTSSREDVEAACRANDTRAVWNSDGSLLTEFLSFATLRHRNGELVFINDLLPVVLGERAVLAGLVPEMGTKPTFWLRWEDDAPIDGPVLEEILKVAYKSEVPVPAKAGDILVLDNTRILHGRRPSAGGDRRVLVRMGAPRL